MAITANYYRKWTKNRDTKIAELFENGKTKIYKKKITRISYMKIGKVSERRFVALHALRNRVTAKEIAESKEKYRHLNLPKNA